MDPNFEQGERIANGVEKHVALYYNIYQERQRQATQKTITSYFCQCHHSLNVSAHLLMVNPKLALQLSLEMLVSHVRQR